MLPGMNSKQVQGMMKQLGMSQEEIPAKRVIIEKNDGGKTIIDNPSVTKIKMQGQETFQVMGEAREENPEPTISEDDVKSVMEKTGADEKTARETLEKTGDLAEAIMELSN